ncbi:Benzoate 1,2-dioxygenase electron transfer component [Kluyvera cryocrescens]|uniref:Benzoate 1,2-dioxygenase electron transfer component n=1 Tax=Kluyvera cryocrescens TaxID=580 RepID=A0A485CFL2_KLUCR|nr:Benzoate 1,2-dioxygenase electron transfer component [Kluyvera cryocrescens]
MSHQITLRFEDGVTQQIDCRAGESVASAALRAKVAFRSIVVTGVCGTCKATCRSGDYQLGDYVDDALSPEEAEAGRVLTCQMHPSSDCVVDIAAASTGASVRDYHGQLTESRALSPTTLTFSHCAR